MQPSNTFRIFVSSTFADLVKERNALQRGVWPELARRCEKDGFRFQAIDLRWGISEEAGLDQRTSRICLQELERCQDISPRPNFIILLGNRYGWRPLPEQIEKKEFEAIEKEIEKRRTEATEQNATERELSKFSLLGEWYRLDNNAVPPVYFLRRRQLEGSVDYTNYDIWSSQVELPLRELLTKCVAAIPLSDSQRIKYERSLTEQEILKGALNAEKPDAKEHVFAYFREVEAFDQMASATESEARELRNFVDFADATQCDMEARQLQRNLRARLEATLDTDHVRKYSATWADGAVSQGHLNSLCDTVLADLWSVISAQIEEIKQKAAEGNSEQLAHEEFGRLRGEGDRFQGRKDILDRIAQYVNSPEPARPLVISGPAGSGKSALMARAAIEAGTAGRVVIQRFIGATPPSVDGRSLLQSLCKELGGGEPPLEYKDLVGEFASRLKTATAERPVIVFLDAVDQLSETDNAKSLVWLPRQLPPHVRLVVSVLEEPAAVPIETGTKTSTKSDSLAILRRRAKPEDELRVEDYRKDDAKGLLAYWLLAENRTLTASQTDVVLKAFERCPRPLFLKLAAEETKLWRSKPGDTTAKMPYDDKPNEKVSSDEMLAAIIEHLFDRLSAPSHHGKLLVERALGYLVASKNGLTEDELLGLLSKDTEFFDKFVEGATQPLPPGIESLPVAVWIRLYSDLQPYLTSRRADGTTLLAFYHRSLEQAARKRFLSNPEIAGQRHKHIAKYFTPAESYGFFRLTLDEQRAWAKKLPPEPRPVNIRMVMELPHQLLEVAKLLGKDDAKSPHWDAVADLLLNIHFLEAKAEAMP